MKIQQIYVDKRAYKYPICNQLLSKYSGAIVTQVDSSWRIKDIKTPDNIMNGCIILTLAGILKVKTFYGSLKFKQKKYLNFHVWSIFGINYH